MRAALVLGHREGGDRDDRDVGRQDARRAAAAASRAVDAGQLQVHQHQVGRQLGGHADALLAGGGRHHVVAGVLEHVAHQLEVERVVLDHEDPRARSRGSSGRRGHADPGTRRASSRSSRLTGLSRYAAAPSASPRARSSTTVTTTTGMSRGAGSALQLGSTSQPSMPGSRMSRTTAAGAQPRVEPQRLGAVAAR